MAHKTANGNVKQKYLEFQLLDQQLKQLTQQMDILEQQLEDARIAKDSVAQIGKVAKGTEILVPVSNGIFIRARIEDSSELLINVGTNVTVSKSGVDTQKLIDTQVLEIQGAHDYVWQQVQICETAMKQIEEEIKSEVDKGS